MEREKKDSMPSLEEEMGRDGEELATQRRTQVYEDARAKGSHHEAAMLEAGRCL